MFDKNIQEILIRRRNKVNLPTPDFYTTSTRKVATLNKNLETGFGYVLNTEVNDFLMRCNNDDISDFYNEVVSALKKMIPQKRYDPMYKNFPSQVMRMDEVELYMNAIMHYSGDATGQRIMPEYEEQERNPLFEDTKIVVLGTGGVEDLIDIFNNLIQSKTSISDQDKEDINKLLDIGITSIAEAPDKIPHKENLAFLAKSLMDRKLPIYQKWFKTATDVLRLAVAMSDGDISLAKKTKFKNFKRRERKYILDLLETLDNDNCLADMARHRNQWIRLGEKLHPGDYQKQFPKSFSYFDMIRNEKVQTPNGIIEGALEDGNLWFVIDELKKTPGEFVRKLDRLLREAPGHNKTILSNLNEVLDNVSTPVLLQTLTHFKNRDNKFRVFLPKGNVQKAYVTENNLKPICKTTLSDVIDLIKMTLQDRFAKLESLGKVYLDEKLKQYTVPFSQRSASKTLKTISRGSKFDMDQENLRFFISWRQSENERVDLDLSATFFDENWDYVDHISYTELKNKYSVHSGDITGCEVISLKRKVKSKLKTLKQEHIEKVRTKKFKDIKELYTYLSRF